MYLVSGFRLAWSDEYRLIMKNSLQTCKHTTRFIPLIDSYSIASPTRTFNVAATQPQYKQQQ